MLPVQQGKNLDLAQAADVNFPTSRPLFCGTAG
jgi:hypothetical protein